MDQTADIQAPPRAALPPRPAALHALGLRMGVDIDRRTLAMLAAADAVEAPALVRCAQEAGLDARALPMGWADVLNLAGGGSAAMLLLKDGGAALLEGRVPGRDAVLLRDPRDMTAPAREVDRARLEENWLRGGIVMRGADAHRAAETPFGLRWIWLTLSPDAKLVRDIGLASVVLAVLGLAPALIFMSIADRVMLFQTYSTLVLFAAMMVVITAFDVLLGWAKRHLSAVLARRVDARMSLFTMERLLRLPLDFFEKTQAGDIQSRIFQMHRVRDFITGPMFRTFVNVVTLVVVLPVLFLISVPLTWLVLLLTAMLVLLILAFRPAIRRATARAVEAERAKAVVLAETVQGMRTIKALAIEPQQSEVWNRRTAEAVRAHFDLMALTNRLETLSEPIEAMFQRSVMIIGAVLVLRSGGDTTIGSLFAFIMLAGRVSGPLMSLVNLLHAIEHVRMAVGEAGSVVNHPAERPAGAQGIRPAIRGRVSFHEVSFTYPGTAAPVLREVSFEAPEGSILGVVGRSGSGKSTITRLLQSLNAGYTGLIKVDGIELRELDLQHLRRNMGVVLQENFMFRGTIRENVAAGRMGVSFKDVIHACRLAGAEEFIERLPRSYDTLIEEGSPNLSGGQKQRLAIARALVTSPPILVLDEATSALDPESEAIVNANLRRIARGRTILMVSHRLSSLVDADRILVLERGEVAGCAPHAELLRTVPAYRALWAQQNRDVREGAP
ncbi:peptidase domain-containing ABC transporter [Roseococcus sp. DSY-14]|uniref:peptidase domain-containing ABC transporter n=1 Tax=Roseococcus sp. DSY-14 TaxID=3369650 RepID=UPI00387AEA83